MADTERTSDLPGRVTGIARTQRLIHAEASTVYNAFIDPVLMERWLPPQGLTCIVHEFEPRAGGRFRLSLANAEAQSLVGEEVEPSDTVTGRILALFPNERIVEIIETATPDPRRENEMTLTIDLRETPDGTDVMVVCSDIPPGMDPDASRDGWALSLEKLAALVE